jgi:hypothetical protein
MQLFSSRLSLKNAINSLSTHAIFWGKETASVGDRSFRSEAHKDCTALLQKQSCGTVKFSARIVELLLKPKAVSLRSSLEHCTREELPLILIN